LKLKLDITKEEEEERKKEKTNGLYRYSKVKQQSIGTSTAV